MLSVLKSTVDMHTWSLMQGCIIQGCLWYASLQACLLGSQFPVSIYALGVLCAMQQTLTPASPPASINILYSPNSKHPIA